jgi:hypothetical protein
MTREAVYLDHDNASRLFLSADGEIVSLSSVTRVIITIDGTDYDSDMLGPSRIWWTDQEEYWRDNQNYDVLKFKLGDQDIPKGVYIDCRIIVFDASNPNGVVWKDNLEVHVR